MREGAGEASGRKVFQAEETGSAKVLRQLKLRCQRDSEEYSVAGANTQKERGRRGFRGGTVKASRVLRTTGRNLDLILIMKNSHCQSLSRGVTTSSHFRLERDVSGCWRGVRAGTGDPPEH